MSIYVVDNHKRRAIPSAVPTVLRSFRPRRHRRPHPSPVGTNQAVAHQFTGGGTKSDWKIARSIPTVETVGYPLSRAYGTAPSPRPAASPPAPESRRDESGNSPPVHWWGQETVVPFPPLKRRAIPSAVPTALRSFRPRRHRRPHPSRVGTNQAIAHQFTGGTMTTTTSMTTTMTTNTRHHFRSLPRRNSLLKPERPLAFALRLW